MPLKRKRFRDEFTPLRLSRSRHLRYCRRPWLSAGLGGGIIIIPVLTLLFHVDIRYADRRLDHFGDCDLERRRRCLCKGAHDPFASGNGARLATSAGALTGA